MNLSQLKLILTMFCLNCLNCLIESNKIRLQNTIHLLFNVEEVTIYKRSSVQFWSIFASFCFIYETIIYAIFLKLMAKK